MRTPLRIARRAPRFFPLGSHQRAAQAPIPKLNPFDRGYDVAKRGVGFWKSKCDEVRVVGLARPRQLTGTGLARIWKRPSVSRRTGKRVSYELRSRGYQRVALTAWVIVGAVLPAAGGCDTLRARKRAPLRIRSAVSNSNASLRVPFGEQPRGARQPGRESRQHSVSHAAQGITCQLN
jgi:hypothetical protein